MGVAFPASAAVLRGRGLTTRSTGRIFLPQMVLAAVGATRSRLRARPPRREARLVLGFVLMALSQAALGAVALRRSRLDLPPRAPRHVAPRAGRGRRRRPAQRVPAGALPVPQRERGRGPPRGDRGRPRGHPPARGSRPRPRARGSRCPSLLAAATSPSSSSSSGGPARAGAARTAGAPIARPLGAPALWLFVGITFLYGVDRVASTATGRVVFLTEERGLGVAGGGRSR